MLLNLNKDPRLRKLNLACMVPNILGNDILKVTGNEAVEPCIEALLKIQKLSRIINIASKRQRLTVPISRNNETGPTKTDKPTNQVNSPQV